MPEQSKDLDAILGAALEEAGRGGLLEGVSDEELARMVIQARIKAAVVGTGVLKNASETIVQEDWRETLLNPTEVRYARDVLCFSHKKNSRGYWVTPTPNEHWQTAIMDYFELDTPLGAIPNRFSLELGELFEVVRPAESSDPTLGVARKGLLRWKGPEGNT